MSAYRRRWLAAGLFIVAGELCAAALAFADEPPRCHRVQPEETLSAIALRYRVPLRALLTVNESVDPRRLRPGTTVALPSAARTDVPVVTTALRARPGNLQRQSRAATRDQLSRLDDLRDVTRFLNAGLLVPVAADTGTFYIAGVAKALRVARPWTKTFIEQLAAALHERFGTRLRITSLTRTTATQAALRRSNGNAAPAHGPKSSTHLTGASVDISTRTLSADELAWLRTVLHRLNATGVIHAIEEFRQPHFHVLVRKRYQTYAATLASPTLIGNC